MTLLSDQLIKLMSIFLWLSSLPPPAVTIPVRGYIVFSSASRCDFVDPWVYPWHNVPTSSKVRNVPIPGLVFPMCLALQIVLFLRCFLDRSNLVRVCGKSTLRTFRKISYWLR